ncbi:unannotated protein [freshwater metagenome]|uniref:Unannotated protein n=1 Tax=freshwater metagenome TaxID=449393 RepID=A0A6J6D3R5_9ZZZZ
MCLVTTAIGWLVAASDFFESFLRTGIALRRVVVPSDPACAFVSTVVPLSKACFT